jgi:serine phosphatase RsbU (regulator of sigma subunit)
MTIAKEIKSASLIYMVAGVLQNAYKAMGNYGKALEYAEILIQTKDTIFSEEKTKALAEMGERYEAEKKQLQIENLNKENALKNAELAQSEEKRNKQLVFIYSFVSGFIIILIFSVIIFRLFMLKKKANLLLKFQKQQIEFQNTNLNKANDEITAQRDEITVHRDLVMKQKDHIEEQKKEITDSINYARRIQTAVLPTGEYADRILREHFILFKPKDIVSGDFYWATCANNWLIVTVADCTGHGVPGAFMSMLGVSFLNEIVRKKEITKASEVLDLLRDSIIEALQQKGTSGEQKDGMDIALCAINAMDKSLQFSGANNPLFIVTANEIEPDTMNEMHSVMSARIKEIRADKQPVAIYENMHPFTNHVINLQNGDMLYLCSDGYKDQFGGSNNKKFKIKQLKELFVNISDKPMKEQQQILDDTFENWRGQYEQIDDVTILGLKM